MKILALIKEVPEVDETLELPEAGGGLRLSADRFTFRMNRFDEYAVEEGLRIQAEIPGSTLDVATVGPERSKAVLKRALGMGADRAVHIRTGDDPLIPPRQTAAWLAALARREAYDLILTGVMSEDGMHGQVGPMLAALLAVSWATSVISRQIDTGRGVVTVEREIESGCRHRLELGLPALLAVQTGINTPRYPSLSNLLRANKVHIETLAADRLDAPLSRQRIEQVSPPGKTRAGRVLEGTTAEKAAKLLAVLKQKALI